MRLFDLTCEVTRIETLIEQYADENDGLVHPDLMQMLEQVELDRDAKIQNCYWLYKKYKRLLEAVEAEKRQIEARRQSIQNHADALREYIKICFSVGEKWKGAVGSIYWQKSKSVEVTDVDKLPPEFVKKEPTNKKQLLIELESGALIDGAEVIESNDIVIR